MAHFNVFSFIAFCLTAYAAASSSEKEQQEFPIPSKPIRLILSDVDGTVADQSYKFVKENIKGFDLARKLGIQVAFVTGRDPEGVEHILGEEAIQKIGYSGYPGVFMNGAYVLNGNGNVVLDAPLSPDVPDRLLKAFETHGLEEVTLATVPEPHGSFRGNCKENQYYTISAYGDPEILDKARTYFEEEFRGEVDFTIWEERSIGGYKAGYDKGRAVRVLMAELGVTPEEVLALGDGENDLSMFEAVGTAVAVRNAREKVKNAADYITVDHKEGALLAVVQEIEKLKLYPGAQLGSPDAE